MPSPLGLMLLDALKFLVVERTKPRKERSPYGIKVATSVVTQLASIIVEGKIPDRS